ncbi:MAG: hypothetical protein V7K68_10420 [Nostoc sp.]
MGHGAWGIGHWALGMGHGELGIETSQYSLVLTQKLSETLIPLRSSLREAAPHLCSSFFMILRNSCSSFFPILNAKYSLPNTQCPMPNAPCPIPNTQYPIPHPIRIETLRNIAFVQKPGGKAPNHQKDRGSMLSVNVKIGRKTFDTTGCCYWVRPCWFICR